MAPEVIVQSGHSYSADIWSVGCTVIEMATGKAPWSHQYKEVAAALFHVGTTKSHPPIPDHLSPAAKDFLLKCLQKEPDLRPTATELLKHPFVTQEIRGSHFVLQSSVVDNSGNQQALGVEVGMSMNLDAMNSCNGLKDFGELGASRSTMHPEQFSQQGSQWHPVIYVDDDDMCRIDDTDCLAHSTSSKFKDNLLSRGCNQSFNPLCEPNDDWTCKFDESPGLNENSQIVDLRNKSLASGEVDCGYSGFTFLQGPPGTEDDEVTESKIKAFLDEKASELTKLQTPPFDEFYKSRSPNKVGNRRFATTVHVEYCSGPVSCSRRVSNVGNINILASQDVEDVLLDSQVEPLTPRFRFHATEMERRA